MYQSGLSSRPVAIILTTVTTKTYKLALATQVLSFKSFIPFSFFWFPVHFLSIPPDTYFNPPQFPLTPSWFLQSFSLISAWFKEHHNWIKEEWFEFSVIKFTLMINIAVTTILYHCTSKVYKLYKYKSTDQAQTNITNLIKHTFRSLTNHQSLISFQLVQLL